MLLYRIVVRDPTGNNAAGEVDDERGIGVAAMALLPSDKLLHDRICQGVPPLERTMAIPESYTFSDALRRFFAKQDIQGRRKFAGWEMRAAERIGRKKSMEQTIIHITRELPRAIDTVPDRFGYLMPGGCHRPLHLEGEAGMKLRLWLKHHLLEVAE